MPLPPSDFADPPLPDDLVDAVEARLLETVVSAGVITWTGLGIAPPGTALPYLAIGEPDEADSYWTTEGDGLADGHLTLAVYGATKKEARQAADAAMAALQDAPLLFAAGTLVYLRQEARSAVLDPDSAPGGGDCWQEARAIHYQYAFDPPGRANSDVDGQG